MHKGAVNIPGLRTPHAWHIDLHLWIRLAISFCIAALSSSPTRPTSQACSGRVWGSCRRWIRGRNWGPWRGNENTGRTQRASREPLILSMISAAATTVYSFLSQRSEEAPAAGAHGRRRGTNPRNRRRDFVVRRGFGSPLYESRCVN